MRLLIILLTTLQAMIAALLGFADALPLWAKIAGVVASAGVGAALNQLPPVQHDHAPLLPVPDDTDPYMWD